MVEQKQEDFHWECPDCGYVAYTEEDTDHPCKNIKQEETRDGLYEKGFRDGQLSERSRHEKELEEIKERFCVYNCDTFCKIIPTCDKFNYVFGIRKKEV
jgi:hypothetical protein